MNEVLELCKKYAEKDITVLISVEDFLGEVRVEVSLTREFYYWRKPQLPYVGKQTSGNLTEKDIIKFLKRHLWLLK